MCTLAFYTMHFVSPHDFASFTDPKCTFCSLYTILVCVCANKQVNGVKHYMLANFCRSSHSLQDYKFPTRANNARNHLQMCRGIQNCVSIVDFVSCISDIAQNYRFMSQQNCKLAWAHIYKETVFFSWRVNGILVDF